MYVHVCAFMNMCEHVHTCLYHVQTRTILSRWSGFQMRGHCPTPARWVRVTRGCHGPKYNLNVMCLRDVLVSVHLQTIESNLKAWQNLYTKSNVYMICLDILSTWAYTMLPCDVDVRSYPNSFSSHCFFIFDSTIRCTGMGGEFPDVSTTTVTG